MDVQFIEYKDSEIMYEPSMKKYYANDEEFDSLEQAKKFLDSGEISDSVRGAYARGLYAEGGEVQELEIIDISDNFREQYEVFVNGIKQGFILKSDADKFFATSNSIKGGKSFPSKFFDSLEKGKKYIYSKTKNIFPLTSKTTMKQMGYAKGGKVSDFKVGDKVVGQFRNEYGEGLQIVSVYDFGDRVNGVISNVRKIDTTTMYSIKFDNGEELQYPDFAISNFIVKSQYAKGGQIASIGDSGIITDKNSMFVGKMATITGDLGNMFEVRVGERTTMVKKNGIRIVSDEYAKGGKVKSTEKLSYWNQQAADLLNGLTIDFAGYATGDKKEKLGLEEDTPVIMAGGKYLIPLLDDEGNGSGVFYVVQPNGVAQIFESGNGSEVYIKQRSMLFNLLVTGVKTKKTIKNASYVDKSQEFGFDNPVLQITLSDNTKIYVLRDAEMNGVGSLVVFNGIDGTEFMLPRISFEDLIPEADKSSTQTALNLKDLEGSWSLYKDGKKEDGYVKIEDAADLQDYITKKLGNVVFDIKPIEQGKNYPYNPTNPYFEDTYLVTLKNGDTFEILRTYGRPIWTGNVAYIESIAVKNQKKSNTTPGSKEDSNSSVIEESKMQIKELQDAIETFAFLLEADVTKEQEKELKEAIETFRFLTNELRTSLRISGGSNQKNEKKKEVKEVKKEVVLPPVNLKDVYNNLKFIFGSGLKINRESENYLDCTIRDWGTWEHDYQDSNRSEEDFEDDDFMILSSDSAERVDEIVEGVQAKYPGVIIRWEPSEKNYIDFEIMRRMAEGGKIGFNALADKVSNNYEGKKVPKKYQAEYGKTYSKEEADEVGNKVAAKVYRQQLKNK